tara:strand:+ start:960 stop:2003 length:1044 start_codon:yes stop_codon:yes gene_type:complete
MLQLLLGFILVALPYVALAELRTWTTTDGRKAQGEIFEMEAGQIGLRISNREYRFSLSRFIERDQVYARKWQSQPRCKLCSKALGTRTMEAGGKTYHTACFKCLVCKKVFKGGDKFRRDQWGMLAHVDHFSHVATCGSCGRMFAKREARKEQILDSNRFACLNCLSDAVLVEKTLDLVNERVKKALAKIGIDKPKGKITLVLVDKPTLDQEAKRIRASGNLKGLTLTKFRTVTKDNVSKTTFEHRILVLHGLPHTECEAVLAHEHMHVWLNELFVEAPSDVVEGFCNLGASHLLKIETNKLSSILLDNMQKSTSQIYGEGYRKMAVRLSQLGWPRLLAEMRSRGRRK